MIIRAETWRTNKDPLKGKVFRVALGTPKKSPRILVAGELASLEEEVVEVPLEFLKDFERDLDGSLKDIAGIAYKGE